MKGENNGQDGIFRMRCRGLDGRMGNHGTVQTRLDEKKYWIYSKREIGLSRHRAEKHGRDHLSNFRKRVQVDPIHYHPRRLDNERHNTILYVAPRKDQGLSKLVAHAPCLDVSAVGRCGSPVRRLADLGRNSKNVNDENAKIESAWLAQ